MEIEFASMESLNLRLLLLLLQSCADTRNLHISRAGEWLSYGDSVGFLRHPLGKVHKSSSATSFNTSTGTIISVVVISPNGTGIIASPSTIALGSEWPNCFQYQSFDA